MRESTWIKKAEFVIDKLNKKLPITVANYGVSNYYWLKEVIEKQNHRAYSTEQKQILSAIKKFFPNPEEKNVANEIIWPSERNLRWQHKLELLIAFRKKHSPIWPTTASNIEGAKNLAIWLQSVRNYYSKGKLETNWINALTSIGFNFSPKESIWETKIIAFQNYGKKTKGKFYPKDKQYQHAQHTYNQFETLTREQQQQFAATDIYRHFLRKHWDVNYTRLLAFIKKNECLPTEQIEPYLKHWYHYQLKKVKACQITDKKAVLLLSIDKKFNPQIDKELQWEKMFNKLIDFRNKNPDRWPVYSGPASEKHIHNWCIVQKQKRAGTTKNAVPLSRKRVKQLNSIGFPWTKAGKKKLNK